MSLIQTQTSTLLGIGTGGVSDVQAFATGIRERRKGRSLGYVTEDAQGRPIKNPKQVTIKPNDPSYKKGERGPNEIPKVQKALKSKKGRPVQDPKQTHKRELAMTTDDRNLIQAINALEGRIFKGENELGKNATKSLKKEVQGLLTLAASSSRGGLADVWSETYDRIVGQHGRTAPGGLATLQGAFNRARSATNKVLDTTVDIKKQKFEAGRAQLKTIGDERQYAREARERGWGADAKTIGFLENEEFKKAKRAKEASAYRQVKLTRGTSLQDLLIGGGGGSQLKGIRG